MGVQINENYWQFTGRIVDYANPSDMTVTFGGVIPDGTSVEVEEDGTFSVVVALDVTFGYATAQAGDGETTTPLATYLLA
jgi:hypothetical protein